MRSPRSRLPVTSPFALAAAIALASLAGSAGCEPPPAAPEPRSGVDAAEQAKIDQSRKKIDEAALAIDEKRYADARKLLDEATALRVESHGFEISEQAEKLDKREAKLWANEVSDQLDEKQCAEAFAELAKQMEERESAVFTGEVQKLVNTQAVACASGKLDELAAAGKLAEARAFLNAQPSKDVLGDASWQKLSKVLEGTIAEALAGQLSEDLKAQRWAAAVDKVAEAKKRGDATDGIAANLLGRIRAAAAPALAAQAAKAVGARKGSPEALKELDAAIAKLGWEAIAADLAGLAKDKALPEDVAKKRLALGAWVESQDLKMKPLKKWEKRWTHGTVAVAPPHDADAPSKRDLKPSTEVWVLGEAKSRALITEADPGKEPLNVALEHALGWVPVDRLAGVATADWVPPNDQLKGVRVWGPLREKQATLELGEVVEVLNNEVSVKRLADDVVVKVQRSQLRNGRLDKGTKVLTLCDEDNQLATIFEYIPGTRVARVQCEGGLQKEQPLASLRSRPDLLPASK